MNKLKILTVKLLTFFIVISFIGLTAADKNGEKNLSKGTGVYNAGEVYRLYVNKIDLPLNHNGKIADVVVPISTGTTTSGRYDGKSVIYSSGFMMSGYSNGTMWSNGMASASRVEDWTAGTVSGEHAGLFVVKSSDPAFGDAWTEWENAVAGGAYFYDGNNDGIYVPQDLNGNGSWDSNEDKPDLLGDETVWCVYNDGLAPAFRTWPNTAIQQTEIRQTVWAYAVSGDLGNIIFVRYSIVNKNPNVAEMDSVYFGVWADPDLGDYLDDLVGCDVTLDAGFVYNDGSDDQFGIDPPAFLIDFFQGPWLATGDPTDEAYNVKGPLLGIDTISGYHNLPITSFVHYMQGHPTQGDPDNQQQARNYLLGKNQAGNVVNACNWEFGTVLGGVNCASIDGRFMYSGDPVTLSGWINVFETDQRQMSNTGPFNLTYNEPVDIVVAYVIGRSTTALNSVKETKRIDRAAQFVYQNNFNYPAPPTLPSPIVKTEDNAIELIWNTAEAVNYNDVGNGYDMHFEGFEVNMYQSGSTAEQEGGVNNKMTIAKYDLDNGINTIIKEDGVSNERDIIWTGGTQLDTNIYQDANSGWLKLRIEMDPFTNGPIIKGKPYFITLTGFAVNYEEIVQLDALGTYLIPGTSVVGTIANIPILISDSSSINGIVPGKDSYTPYRANVNTTHLAGGSEGEINYSVFDKSALTGHSYEVGFFIDSLSALYNLFYYVKDATANVVLADSLQNYNDADGITKLWDGVTLNVGWVVPNLLEPGFTTGGSWAKPFINNVTGAFYGGNDIDSAKGIPTIGVNKGKITKFADMRRLELRFGTNGKAYRYTSGKAAGRPTGKLFYGGEMDGMGFVDVPFTAWIRDEEFGEERQLACAILENGFTGTGRQDGIWNPGSDLTATLEYIVIFNTDYEETGVNVVYTQVPGQTASKWANIKDGYTMVTSDPGYVVTDSMYNVAKSPYFNALAMVGVETVSNDSLFEPTDGTMFIPITYVFTPKDVYTYTVQTDLDANEAKNMFAKVNVYPNPLFAYNPVGSYTTNYNPDEPFVTFTNLPEEAKIQIFTLSGTKVRELNKDNTNPMLNWNLKNESDLRVASGMYIAVVSNPEYGEKILKFAIILPQKQIQRY